MPLESFSALKNLISDAGFTPHAIPPKLFLPLIEAASLEDNELLQERWAALLTNASNEQQSPPVLSSFGDVLRQLMPEQAIFLNVLLEGDTTYSIKWYGIRLGNFPEVLKQFENANGVRGSIEFTQRAALMIDQLVRLGIVSRMSFDQQTIAKISQAAGRIERFKELDKLFDVEEKFFLTLFGLAFIQACTAPQAKTQS